MKNYIPVFFILLFFKVSIVGAQENTVGLLSYNQEMSFDGYNLIYPLRQPNVYLLNNCGEIVHTWEGTAGTQPGVWVYLLDNGNIVKTTRPNDFSGDTIWAPGGGASIEIYTWDNELLFSFTRNDEQYRLHHDIEVMPNGNILAVVWERKTKEEAIAAGRDSMNIVQGALFPDDVMEIDTSTGEIVWQWNMWDHLIQDNDETKANYGVVAEHPELMDLNWDTYNGKADWMHTNAIDYHPEYDQIMLSIPNFNEVWIIDHRTTTEQASSHTGGQYGKGGDIIYRWGNPQVYGAGDSTDTKLFFPHDTHWNLDHISPAHPDYGKVFIFNNQVGEDYSTAELIDPMFDDYDQTYMIMDGQYIPAQSEKVISHPIPSKMWSTGLSSVQQLPNDNYLITVGRFGYSFELTPDNDIVWEYVTPINVTMQATQGDVLSANDNLTFRMHRYPTNYGAFSNKDLTAKGWIELEPNEDYCERLVDISEIPNTTIKLYPIPANRTLTIELDESIESTVEIYNLSGQKCLTQAYITQVHKLMFRNGVLGYI